MMTLPLASQVEFCCLSVPDLQHVDSIDRALETEVFSRSGSSHSAKGQISAEQSVTSSLEYTASVLAGAEESFESHREHMDMDDECSSHISTVSTHYDPSRVLPIPVTLPKHFPRTLWRSITLRLVKNASTDTTAVGLPQ